MPILVFEISIVKKSQPQERVQELQLDQLAASEFGGQSVTHVEDCNGFVMLHAESGSYRVKISTFQTLANVILPTQNQINITNHECLSNPFQRDTIESSTGNSLVFYAQATFPVVRKTG